MEWYKSQSTRGTGGVCIQVHHSPLLYVLISLIKNSHSVNRMPNFIMHYSYKNNEILDQIENKTKKHNTEKISNTELNRV